MKQQFSLFQQLEIHFKTLAQIKNSIQITLGPTGKNGISSNEKGNLKIISTGSILLNSLEFPLKNSNILLKLLQQSSSKTSLLCGDGSTITILLCCELLENSLKLLENGYNAIFLSNGLKRIASYFLEKIVEFSSPISNKNQLLGLLKTSLGKKVNSDLVGLLENSISYLKRDGLILLEDSMSDQNEIEFIEGIELEKGFASSYFVTNLKEFQVIFEKPYLLVTSNPIESIDQIRDIIDFVKSVNRPLVIVAEDIKKEILSTLILNHLQKKFQVVVVKYTGIQFQKTNILEDLSLLTHSNYLPSDSKIKEVRKNFQISDLGYAEKVFIDRKKSTFLVSKFSKFLRERRINELNRELLNSETDYEKTIFKTRIARLSGNITKLKIGFSNQYLIEEQRTKLENALQSIRSALEEGILPGGGSFYLFMREELSNWGSVNLIGEEILANFVVMEALLSPFKQLCINTNNENKYSLLHETLLKKGYPYAYNFLEKEIVHTFETGLIDSAKVIRASFWNSLSLVSTIVTSE